MNELLTLLGSIAIWCGNPGYQRLTPGEINSCRQWMLDCTSTLSSNGNSVTLKKEGEVHTCFKNKMLK